MTKSDDKSPSTALVACGVLRPELAQLETEGKIDFSEVHYTAPGLHDNPEELERQLRKGLDEALKTADRVVVGFGDRCMFNLAAPERTLDAILADYGDKVTRLQAGNCAEFLADDETRKEIAADREVYWLTPGWLKYRKAVFRYFDESRKGEAFGRCAAAVLLCPLGTFDELAMSNPEVILDLSDWMELGIEPAPVDLTRFEKLLDDARKSIE